jgi:hypothetical protein
VIPFSSSNDGKFVLNYRASLEEESDKAVMRECAQRLLNKVDLLVEMAKGLESMSNDADGLNEDPIDIV